MKTRDFENDAQVAELVRSFEAATIAPDQFPHTAHIAVALAYLDSMSLPVATARMRASLRAFTAHHRVDVYHETLTTFWMRLLDHVATTEHSTGALWQRINEIVARWGTDAPVNAHYSRELVKSAAARERWIEPDKLPLPF